MSDKKRKDRKLSHWLKVKLGSPAPMEYQDVQSMAEGKPQKLVGEVIADNIAREAMKGERWAIELSYDRTEGKPIQAVKEDTGERSVEERIEDVTKHHLNELASNSAEVMLPPNPLMANLPTHSPLIPSSLAQRIADATNVSPILATTAPEQYGEFWTCPATGITIPKTVKGNLRWRQRILNDAAMDENLQSSLRAACAESVYLWINLFCWTFRPKIVDADGKERDTRGAEAHYPFITWKVQDEAIAGIYESFNGGGDIGFDKSREMGASWIILTSLHHQWQFREAFTALELSRVEELVDQKAT
jgi:hypothetical protein